MQSKLASEDCVREGSSNCAEARGASADCVNNYASEIGIKELLKISAEARGAHEAVVTYGEPDARR